MTPIILASSSKSRLDLLKKLQIPFTTTAPQIDETPLPNEDPIHMVARLAEEKAQTQSQFTDHIVIASDQTIAFKDQLIGKPKNQTEAIQQISLLSGQTAFSYTSLFIQLTKKNYIHKSIVTTEIRYRKLSQDTILSYINQHQPYDCAGSIKLEADGFLLIDKLLSPDPYAVYGLPLFSVITSLKGLGVNLPHF